MKTIKLNDNQLRPANEYYLSERMNALNRRCRSSRLQVAPTTHVVHEGLLDYLLLAYRCHYSVVIKPDDIWFMVISELTQVVAKKPEAYASLFTTTPDQRQTIIVPTLDPAYINVDLVIDSLKDCVPARTDLFLPAFSTTTPDARMALYVAFCDMVSPYYKYCTTLCGIPAIRFEGTIEDWQKLVSHLNSLCELLRPLGQAGTLIWLYLSRCYSCVKMLVEAIVNENVAVLNRMIKLELCGSGGDEASGWIFDLLVDNKKPVDVIGLPPHLARMKYKNIETGRTFELFTGLTESALEDTFLVPHYGQYVVETTKRPRRRLIRIIGSANRLRNS